MLNQPSLEVQVTRDELGDEAEAVVLRLAELLDVPVADLRESLQDDRYYPFQAVPVAEFVDEPAEPGHASRGQRVKLYIEEHPELFPGVSVESVAVRAYPFEAHAAHILGQVGLIEAGDYDRLKARGYGQNDMIGRAGLEVVYERWLRGTKGVQKLIVNADGEVDPGPRLRAVAAGGRRPPHARDGRAAIRGGCPQRGDGASPEPDRLRRQAAPRERRRRRRDGRRHRARSAPWRPSRRSIPVGTSKGSPLRSPRTCRTATWLRSWTGPPSSATHRARRFKPVTGLVAVKEGVASLGGYYPCTSEYVHPNDESGAVFENWSVSNRTISIAEALRVSCDTVFYRFGSDFYFDYVNNQLGANGQVLQKRLREWGFGATTGLDLPAEAPGLVPDAVYAEEHPDRYPYGWNPGGDILTMIGSGDLQVDASADGARVLRHRERRPPVPAAPDGPHRDDRRQGAPQPAATDARRPSRTAPGSSPTSGTRSPPSSRAAPRRARSTASPCRR